MAMNRFERRLLIDTCLLGIALTMLTVLLDRLGVLKRLELYLDDERATYFQYFRSPPTDQLVHIDIDDATYDALGSWPWPREDLAQMLDEMDTAGAKVVGIDSVFSETQRPTIEAPGQPPVDHDGAFAAAMDRFRKEPGRGVLLPVSVNIVDPPPSDPGILAVFPALREELERNLELEDTPLPGERISPMVKGLIDKGLGNYDLDRLVPLLEAKALDDAMFERIQHELDMGHSADPEKLREVLLPKSFASGIRSDQMNTMLQVLPHVQSFEARVKFMRPLAPKLPPLYSQDREFLIPIPQLSKAAGFSGFVDMPELDDGKVRSIPLWLLDRGRMLPQMGMSLACAELGVDPHDLILSSDSVTIPLPSGKKIVIPLHVGRDRYQGEVGMMMDIPWWGTGQWQTMYDWPNYKDTVQHHSLVEVWDICTVEPKIEDNNREALEDVAILDHDTRIRDKHPAFDDAQAWNKLIQDRFDDLPPGLMDYYQPYLDGKANTDTLANDEDRLSFSCIKKLLNRIVVNNSLTAERAKERAELRTQLFGKAVLIGWVATGTVDRREIPLSDQNCPGVVVHGAVFNAILTGDFIHPAPAWTAFALTLLVGGLATFAATYLSPARALFSAALITAVFLLCNFSLAYDWGRVEMDAAGPVTAAVLIWSGCTLTRFIRERTEKAHITARFRSYVDPSLVNYLLDHPDKATLAGEQRELTVVFTDLAGFTTLSEVLKEETVKLLNEYLGRMEPVIRRNHGYLNKFLGDGIMFFFGAPEPYPGDPDLHAWAAVQTVVEMQAVMVSFNEDLVKRGLPELKMRAGVSTGMVTVGDAGTPARSDYTVIGDRANLASRLESGNKATGTLILLSDRTVELMNGRYLVRPIGRLQVVGKKEPVMTYEPLAPMENATDEMRKLVAMTKAVTDSYIAGQFAECVAATHQLLTTYGDASQGKLCALYRRLSMEYLRIPPREFLGEIKLESK